MSRARRDPHRSKQRRERIRRQQHAERTRPIGPGPLVGAPPGGAFDMERRLREIRAIFDHEKPDGVETINRRMEELTQSGSMPAQAEFLKGDDPKWQAQNLAYDALETDSLPEALQLVNEALQLDPHCTDAQRLLVSLLPQETADTIHLMREVVETYEQDAGPEFFEENRGHFWGMVETRPYMRAMQHYAEMLIELQRYEEAVEVVRRMLELNPNDNQGMRDDLVPLLLAIGSAEAAAKVLDDYEGEEGFWALPAWSRVIERWLSSDLEGASAARRRARGVNGIVQAYATGAAKLPDELPEYYAPGSLEEALLAAKRLEPALKRHPGFIEWLRR